MLIGDYTIKGKGEEINTRKKITLCQLINDILINIEKRPKIFWILYYLVETKIQETIEKEI